MRIERVTGDDGDDETPGRRKCIALRIDPGAGTFACSIYETRPQVCRDLERGGGACRGELAAKSDRPKRALAVLRGALTS
jgi:Fe-S-cluster containining protein